MSDTSETNADDITFETDPEGAENAAPKKAGFGKSESETVASLKEKLAQVTKEKQEYLLGWQRAQADYANLKKEEDKNRREFTKYAQEKLIAELIPAMQSFHSAFGNKEAWEKVDLNWRMGVQYIYSQLLAVLENNGISLIEPKISDVFDPVKHSSVESVPVEKKEEDHTVREVLQKGFALHDKIVEPARVKVGEYIR